MRFPGRSDLAGGALLLVGCVGAGGPDVGFDGGFPDAPVVVMPPSRVIDESRDLGLLLEVRLPPEMGTFGDPEYWSMEVTAYDDTTGDVAWLDREPSPLEIQRFYFGPPDPVHGTFPIVIDSDVVPRRLEYDPRSEALIEPVGGGLTEVPLDFGTFYVDYSDACRSLDNGDPRVIGGFIRSWDWGYELSYDRRCIQPLIGPRASVTFMRKGPGGTLMLDAYRYGPPELRVAEEAWNGAPVEWIEHYVEGVYDVFLVEPETAIVVGTGERVVPTVPTGRPRNLQEPTAYHEDLVDRAGRTYVTVGGDDTVSRQTIYRSGIDGTNDEVVLDWGDATECLLTRIVAVGPEGHLLTRQRPEEPSPVSIVCLFAPDGSLVLSLPPDPDRRWIGFSDPVQWY